MMPEMMPREDSMLEFNAYRPTDYSIPRYGKSLRLCRIEHLELENFIPTVKDEENVFANNLIHECPSKEVIGFNRRIRSMILQI